MLFNDYSVYGLTLRSAMPLSYPRAQAVGQPDVVLHEESDAWFEALARTASTPAIVGDWYEHSLLADGSDLLVWPGLFQFVVSTDGSRVTCGRLADATTESFESYLLGAVMSYALVRQGMEPLHATAVVVDGAAVAFAANSGMGKSTLAAAFLAAGHQVVTDDMFVLRDVNGCPSVFPGPRRIKLRPHVSQRFCASRMNLGVMNPWTDKWILPLQEDESSSGPLPVRAIFILEEPDDPAAPVVVERLPRADAVLALVGATANLQLRSPQRLRRQFDEAVRLTESIPVMRLSYPRRLELLPDVLQAVRAQVRHTEGALA